MKLNPDVLKEAAHQTYAVLTKLMRVREIDATIRLSPIHALTATFPPNKASLPQSSLRRTLSEVEVPDFSMEDIYVTLTPMRTMAQGRIRHFNVTYAFVSDDGETALVACNFCPELGTFDFRAV